MSDSPVDYDPFRSGEIARTVPSTEPQREIIASALLGDSANRAFNEGISIRFPYAVSPDNVSTALADIVRRHDSLRATFTRTGDELCVASESDFTLRVDDQRALASDDIESYLHSLWQTFACSSMNLFDGPLFQATLVQLPEDEAELIIGAHHVICDGWSFYIIITELTALLSGETLSASPQSFADFAERQDAEQLSNSDIDYWLSLYQASVPEVDLPTNRARPADRSFIATRHDFVFDSQTLESIKGLAKQAKASIVQTVFAGVAALMHKLTGADDLAIGLPVARQNESGLQNLLGHAVQLLPIRVAVTPELSFVELMRTAKTQILDAQEHPNFTFGTLVRELRYAADPSRVPIVPIIFNIDQPLTGIRAEGHELSIRSLPRVGENFEIFLNVMPRADDLLLEVTYNTDLFDAQTIAQWIDVLKRVLLTAAHTPEIEMSALWAGAGHEAAVLSGPRVDQSGASWLDELQQRVETTPDARAVCDAEGSWRYAQLSQCADSVAGALIAQGVQPGDVVAHCMRRSKSLVAVMLGIMRAGATMLPLDPAFPAERLSYMLSDANACLMISDDAQSQALAQEALPVLLLADVINATPAESLPTLSADQSAYLIYTSGSTGKPKGVLVAHAALRNFLSAMSKRPGFGDTDRLLAVTTTSFDISNLELLLPLFCGGSVFVASKQQATDARLLAALIDAEDITVMQATPATWRMLLADRWPGNAGLRVLCGGEAMPVDLARTLVPIVGALWNMYGPTETTIWSSCKKIEPGFESITVGEPIDNTQFVILDDSQHAVPGGVPGELCIGGDGLALGYLGREELTRERFIDTAQFGRLYRTGDRARIIDGNDVQFLGRFDDQVKVRGFRIELGDIEAALQDFNGIEQAAAYVWSVSAADQRIVGCCKMAAGQNLATHRLRKFLRQRLPDYMIPQHFIDIESVPLSPSGKVDRKSLPRPVAVQSKIGAHTPPQNAAEKVIAGIWESLIKPGRPVGREDKFFEIGGHSLLGLEAVYLIEERLSVRLHPRILYTDTLAEVAQQCDAADAQPVSRPRRLDDAEPRDLSLAQMPIALADDSIAFNLPSCFRITGKLDIARLSASVSALFTRHDALSMAARQTDRQWQANAVAAPELQCQTFTGDEAAVLEIVSAMASTPCDLQAGPLAQVRLLSSEAQEHYLCFVPTQFAFDGWSFDIFLRELEAAYANGGELEPLAQEALRYSDFATWQRSQPIDDQSLSFWRERAQTLAPLPDWQRPVEPASGVGSASFSLDLVEAEAFEAFAQSRQLKPADVLLSAFASTLASSAGVDSVCVDLATAGRYLPDLYSIIGLFYQDLPLRVYASANVSDSLQQVADSVQTLAQYQNVARVQIEQALGQSLLQPAVAFSYQQATERPTIFADMGFSQIDVPRAAMLRDLDFWVRRTPTGLVGQFDFRADVVDAQAVQQLCVQLKAIMTKLARRESAVMVEPVDGLFAEQSKGGLFSKLFA
ncbi:MAG: amino acid adenylation domain-containing protein [Pseudomonadota bacterium]